MNRSDSNRILLVDDDLHVHQQVRAILESDGQRPAGCEGLQLDSAYEGRLGWQAVRQALEEYRPYMLAVVDLTMPDGWDGIETIRRIWDVDPELLVILCVDHPDADRQRVAAQLGRPKRLWTISKACGMGCLRQCVAWQLAHLRLREELHQTTLQLESAEQTIKQLHEEAEQAGRLRGNAIKGLQHDLHALMHAILGFSHLLMREPHGPDGLRRLRHVHETGESLLRRVDEVLSLCAPHHGAGCLAPGVSDPATLSQEWLAATSLLAPSRPSSSCHPTPSEDAAANSTRYLIVDDEEICRELLVEMLQPYGQCDTASDGEGALESFQHARREGRPYDVVFLDIMMPGLNGHEVLERVRGLETEWGLYGPDRTKAIMTTALADSKHLFQALRNNCEAYVVKPFSENDIFAAMRRLDVATVEAR